MRGPYFLYLFIKIGFILAAVHSKGLSQCGGDYSTTNNFCDLDSLYLTAWPSGGVEPYTFLWETGETTQTISIPLAFGDYMVTITDANGCTVAFNCHIKPFPDVLYYPFNQNACEGQTVTLFLEWFRDSIPGATYLWSTGETTSTIQITDDIVWSATVTDPNTGCEFIIPPNLFDFHPTPYPEIVGPTTICPGQTITLSVDGGPFGSIIWYPGDIYAPTLDVTEPGTYIVWGSSVEAGWCWHQDTITIVPGDIDPPLLTGPANLCEGQSGIIDITNSSEYVSFLWEDGQTTSSISVTQPGTYNVTVTDVGGCTATGEYTVGAGPGPNISETFSPATCGESNGSINLTISPTGSYTFEWSNGSNTEDLNNIPGGIYIVTVTSTDGCTAVASITLPDNQIPFNIAETITPNTSCLNPNGAIDLSITPPGSYVYSWSTGETSQDIINLSPGTYTVTITTGINCILTEEFTITEQSNAPLISPTIVPATCGLNNGAIDLQISGGTPPFSFVWSNGSTEPGLINIAGGTYSVTVTGADGCESTSDFDLPDNPIDFNVISIITPNTSCISANGSIDLDVFPIGAYTFLWSNGETTEDINNVPAGNYSVSVTLGATCIETFSFSLNNVLPIIVISGITTPNTSCSQPNGTIDISISNSGSYTYQWSNGETSEDLQQLTGGIYGITVTDENGCTSTSLFTIDNTGSSFSFNASVLPNTSCFSPNGSIDLSINPPGTYFYSWSNGETSEDVQNLAEGMYGVTVSDVNNCSSIAIYSIADTFSFPQISALVTPALCGNNTGTIDITVLPFNSYTYVWSNGNNMEDQASLDAGTYEVTVTDTLGCMSTGVFIIDNITSITDISAIISSANCGGNTGGIDVVMTPPGNYTFLWSNGEISEDLQNIFPGIYHVLATDTIGCTIADTFIVTNNNSNFSIAGISNPNTSCTSANGSIDLAITPSGNYSFLWSNGEITEDLFNIPEGTYTVTVTDSLLCASTATFTIDQQLSLISISPLITPATCGLNNGSIDLRLNPSTGNNFLWSNGSLTEDLINLAPGAYSVTVTATNGCTMTDTFSVQSLGSSITLAGNPSSNTNCVVPNGNIDLTVSPIGNYSFLWSNGAISEDQINLPSGIYTVTVSDINGCFSSGTYIVGDQTFTPDIFEVITPSTCGSSNGQIDLTISPIGIYQFHWSTGHSNEDIQNMHAGIYSVTVTGSNGCTSNVNFTIPDSNNHFSITAITTLNTSCLNGNGAFDLTILPTGNYSFQWSNGDTTEDLQNLKAGVFVVTVTDPFLCSASDTFYLLDSISVITVTSFITPGICGEPNGFIDLSVIPPTGNTFQWSDGTTHEDLENIAPGLYSVTVTGQNGCTWTSSFNLPSSAIIEVDLDAFVSNEDTDSITITVEVNIPYMALDIITWFPEDLFFCDVSPCMEQTIKRPSQQTEIRVMVMDTNGCMAEAYLMLDVVTHPEVYIPNVFSPNRDGVNDLFTVYGNEDVELILELQIFDRWGNFVFVNTEFPPNDPNLGWDGRFRNEDMNPAVFAYWTKVRFIDGREGVYKGDVTLLR